MNADRGEDWDRELTLPRGSCACVGPVSAGTIAWVDIENRKVKEKEMANLKRKLIALFFVLVFTAATVAVTGCAKEEPQPKAPEKKLPEEL